MNWENMHTSMIKHVFSCMLWEYLGAELSFELSRIDIATELYMMTSHNGVSIPRILRSLNIISHFGIYYNLTLCMDPTHQEIANSLFPICNCEEFYGKDENLLLSIALKQYERQQVFIVTMPVKNICIYIVLDFLEIWISFCLIGTLSCSPLFRHELLAYNLLTWRHV